MNSYPARGRHPFRAIAVGAAILMGFSGGQAVAAEVSNVRGAVDTSCEDADAATQEAVEAAAQEACGWPDFDSTSIAVQSNTTSAVDVSDWPDFDSTSIAVRPSTISVADGSDWPDFDSTSLGDKARAADAEPLPDYALTMNGRSIMLTESKEAPV